MCQQKETSDQELIEEVLEIAKAFDPLCFTRTAKSSVGKNLKKALTKLRAWGGSASWGHWSGGSDKYWPYFAWQTQTASCKCCSVDEKFSHLKTAKGPPKREAHNGVYINPDLTRLQWVKSFEVSSSDVGRLMRKSLSIVDEYWQIKTIEWKFSIKLLSQVNPHCPSLLKINTRSFAPKLDELHMF